MGDPQQGSHELLVHIHLAFVLGEVAPNQATLGAYGYVGFIGAPFSDQQGRLTNLYWRQRLNGGRATLVAGYLDVTDYADTLIGGSPWTGFSNLAFSTGSAPA